MYLCCEYCPDVTLFFYAPRYGGSGEQITIGELVVSDAALNEQLLIESHYGVVIHRDFKPLYADDNYARFLGYQNGNDILALPSLLPLIASHEQQKVLQEYHAIMAGSKKPGGRTCFNTDKDGNEFFVLAVDHVVEWLGQPAMQVTIIDLSHHVETQARLQASEERYRELVEGSIQGILVHKNFRPLFCNQAYAQIFGFDDEQALMRQETILPLIASSYHLQSHQDNHALLNGEKEAIKAEVKGIRTDGSTVWLNLLSRSIQWNGAQAVQVTAIDITEQQLLRKQLEHRANYDVLTNLLNRRAVMELLEKRFAYDLLHANPLCCVLIDFDNFKQINDRHGHHTGDEVLKLFASSCQSSIRKSDIIGRWGGEEFVLILPNTDVGQAAALAGRLCESIARLRVAAGERGGGIFGQYGGGLFNRRDLEC